MNGNPSGGLKPVRRVRRGKPRPRTPEEMREAAEESYLDQREMMVRIHDFRAQEDLRRRADGQPSSRPPAATLPLRLWATILEEPVGEEYDALSDRLTRYELWLQGLKRHGLYHGPTKLTRVNPPADDATGGATSGES